eukprot:CAMPEP_0172610152 /NCGR_PEP_ID=MMETSP1068-20121228/30006_1 /TAXON_ID=35684 /ORGANISM="Pseudopedinella elastica, Strain CCMP716" /LENGTH=141 /DNA_ID=CAMNT_0013413799 /DNA_START=105 /DNA_END=527 /DNA_ORIENTATION=-
MASGSCSRVFVLALAALLSSNVAFGFIPSSARRGSLGVASPSRNSMGPQQPSVGRASIVMMAADFYRDLGVTKSADEREVKSAFRRAAKKYHPDVNPNGAEEWAKVNRAYEVLSDPDQRKRYDMYGEAGVQGAAGGGGGGG